MDELSDLVRAWSIRARLQQSLRWLFAGLAAGLGIAILPAIAARLSPLADPQTLMLIGILCAMLGAACALAWPWLAYRRGKAGWARWFDQQFHLGERLSTAYELHAGIITVHDDHLRRLQQSDALVAAQQVNPGAALPLRLSLRQALVASLALAALILAIVLPNPQQQILASREETRRALAEQAKALEDTKQSIEQSPNLSQEQKQQAQQAIQGAQNKLNDPNATPEQALAALNDAQAKLDALRDQAWQQKREDLRRAGQSLQADELTDPLADALTKDDLKQAADQLRELTQDQAGGPLPDTQQQQLANQLDQMARSLQRTDPQSAQRLREAAQRLRENSPQAAQEKLDQVADALEQGTRSEAASKSIDEAQAQLDDARRAVAQAGDQEQTGEKGTTASSRAQGQPAGQPGDRGQSQPAQSAGQPEAGQPAGNGEADKQAGQTVQGHHEDTGTDNSVYAPGARLGADGSKVVLPDQSGNNAPDTSGQTNPGISGGATVPYQQVYRDYAQVADEALQTGSVPPNLRDYVRDYFSSLNPGR